MDAEASRWVLKTEPFRPFALRMNDGREFLVNHPEWLMVGLANIVFVDPSTENVMHPEPLLIASVHVSKPKTNDLPHP